MKLLFILSLILLAQKPVFAAEEDLEKCKVVGERCTESNLACAANGCTCNADLRCVENPGL